RTLTEYLGRYEEAPAKRIFHGMRLALSSAARARRGISEVDARQRDLSCISGTDSVLKFNMSDPISEELLAAFGKSGASIAGIIHDTIPVTHPHLSGG